MTSLPRIPLNTLAIAFGLAGLAGLWSTAVRLLGVPAFVAEILWVITAVGWLWLIVAHLVRGFRSSERLADQLRHPAQGHVAALVPVVGMLLGAHLYGLWPVGGVVLVVASITVEAVFSGWLLSFWASGQLKPEAFNPAYLLPTVASGLVGAATAATVGLPVLAVAAFAIGILFWLAIFPILIARLAFLPALPDPLVPTLAILLAPPAVAGTAWFVMMGEHPDPLSVGFLGVAVLLVLMQLALVPRYLRLKFSLGFWSFTFSFAAAARYGIEWASVAAFPGWQAVAVVLVILVTGLVLGIGVRSVAMVVTERRGSRLAERQLLIADAEVESEAS